MTCEKASIGNSVGCGDVIEVLGEHLQTDFQKEPTDCEWFGDFCRAIELPEDIEADRLVAKCRDGVLRIVIPKTESNRPRPIKIDISQD